MPKISAPTVREHHAAQRDLILDAVGDILAERGPGQLELAQVARRVGLARTSLYRYGRDRDDLVAAWLDREFGPIFRQAEDALEGPGEPFERLMRWLDVQVAFAEVPRHRAAGRIMAEFASLPPSVKKAMDDQHSRMNASLLKVVRLAVADQPDRDPQLVASLISAVTTAAVGCVTPHGGPAAKQEATIAFTALLGVPVPLAS
jgi:AcrR family transcriptional regulator